MAYWTTRNPRETNADIDSEIARLTGRLEELDAEKAQVKKELFSLQAARTASRKSSSADCGWHETYDYSVLADGVRIDRYRAFDQETVTIPDEIDGVPVVAIGKKAFSGCSGIKHIRLPDTVTSIGDHAFAQSGICDINMPLCLRNIWHYAFCMTDNLTSVKLHDGIQILGSYAFSHSGLREITVPGSVKSISGSAFSNCVDLAHVTLCEGTESIGEESFSRWRSSTPLVSIDIPNGVVDIGDRAFKNTVLRHLRLPDSVKKICDYSFDSYGLTVYCNPGSYAMQYAREKGCSIDRYENYEEHV